MVAEGGSKPAAYGFHVPKTSLEILKNSCFSRLPGFYCNIYPQENPHIHVGMYIIISLFQKVYLTGDLWNEKRDLIQCEIPFHEVFIGFEIIIILEVLSVSA